MNFKTLMVTILLIGLFTFSFLSFSINYTENVSGNSSSILDNAALNSTYSRTNSTLRNAEDTSANVKTAFDADTPTLTAGFFLLSSIISGTKTLGGILITLYDTTFGLIASVLGVSDIVMGVFISILLIMIVFAAYTLYKQGDTE